MADQELRAYLLGTLSDEATAALEARYFDDDTLRERLEREEETLVEDYADGRLDPVARVAFERQLAASPARRQQARIVRGLVQRAASLPAPAPTPAGSSRRFAWEWLAAAAAAAAVVAGVRWTRHDAPVAETGAPAPVITPAPGPPATGTPTPPSAMVAITLVAGATRAGGSAGRVELPPDAGLTIRLRYPGAQWAGRAVTIRDVDSGTRWHGSATRRTDADDRSVAAVVSVPPGTLTRGDYVVAVAGRADAQFFLSVR